MNRILLFFLSIITCFPLCANTVCIKKTAVPPIIDGKITADEWKDFALSDEFKIFRSGTTSPIKTSVWMSWDADCVYLALKCEDFEKKLFQDVIWNTPRAEIFFGTKSEQIQLMRGSNGDIYPKGAQWFRSASRFDGSSWCVEFAIPRDRIKYSFSTRVLEGNIVRSEPKQSSTFFPILSPLFLSPAEFGTFLLGTPSEIVADRIAELKKRYGVVPESERMVSTGNLSNIMEKLNQFAAEQENRRNMELAKKLSGRNVPRVTAASSSQYSIPDNWQVRTFFGKKFWVMMMPLGGKEFLQSGTATGIPFFREAMFDLRHWEQGDYFQNILDFDPERSAYGVVLKKTNQPFMICGTAAPFHSPKDHPVNQKSMEKFLKTYSDRFAGMFNDEAFGHNYTGCAEKIGLPAPKTRREALEMLEKMYNCETMSLFHSWAVFYPELKNCRLTGTATWLDHQLLGFGDQMNGTEIGGPSIDYMSMQMAFSRGAARQYGKPWKTYVATHDDDVHFMMPYRYNINSSSSFIMPKERKLMNWGGYFMLGDLMGVTREDYDKFYIHPYMSGTNILYEESAHHHMLAKFDYRKIAGEDPLVVNLREPKTYLSEITSRYVRFYDEVIKKHDRGVAYTPVAMLWDHTHGILKQYSSLIWDTFPLNEGDNHIWGIVKACYPYEKSIYYNRVFKRCPFGDIFDVITTQASAQVMESYPVILLCGNVEFNAGLAEKVTSYVRNGGTLILNIEQIRKYQKLFPETFFGSSLDEALNQANRSFSRLSGQVINEDQPFEYVKLIPTATSSVLAVTADDTRNPLIISTPFGRGRVVLSAPSYMKEKYSQNMLKLFTDLMHAVNTETMPINVSCSKDIEYTVNRNKNGWVVGLYNHYGTGYKRTSKNPRSMVAPAEKREVILIPKTAVSKAREWLSGSELPFQNGKVSVTVPPGGVKLIEFY